MDEKTLNEEEQKAKEYVDFYYFWLFHYCGRNYSRELNKRIPHYNGVYDSSVDEQRQLIAQEIYGAHPLSSMHPQFFPGEDFADIDDLFEQDCASESLPNVILEKLYTGEELRKNITYNSQYGVEIIGTSGAHISTDGHLRGSIIAKIDLRAPVSSILFELSKLKEEKFDSFPNFMDAPTLGELEGNYVHQASIIKQTTSASFSVKDDAARAIGLWFYDAIEGHFAIFKNFAEAWNTICKVPVEDILVGDDIPSHDYNNSDMGKDEQLCLFHEQYFANNETDLTDSENEIEQGDDVFFVAARKENTKITWDIPSREVFAKLGYSASDPSVFRRLYRNTQKCIEACEVLSLKS